MLVGNILRFLLKSEVRSMKLIHSKDLTVKGPDAKVDDKCLQWEL